MGTDIIDIIGFRRAMHEHILRVTVNEVSKLNRAMWLDSKDLRSASEEAELQELCEHFAGGED